MTFQDISASKEQVIVYATPEQKESLAALMQSVFPDDPRVGRNIREASRVEAHKGNAAGARDWFYF